MKTSHTLLAGLAHTLLCVLTLPMIVGTHGLWACSLFALAPLAWLADRLARSDSPRTHAKRLALVLWACCLPKELLYQWWAWSITPVGVPPMVMIQSCWPPLFVLLMALAMRRIPRVPAIVMAGLIWTSLEVFRGEIFFGGYRWSLLALPLVHAPLLREAGSVLGIYGAGTLLAMLGASAGIVLSRPMGPRGLLPFALASLLLLVVSLIGTRASTTGQPRELRSLILQTNIPSSNKTGWEVEDMILDFLHFENVLYDGMKAAGEDRPHVILWPETMMPGGPIHPDVTQEYVDKKVAVAIDEARVPNVKALGMWEFADALAAMQARLGVPMLVGDETPEGFVATLLDDKTWEFKYDRRFNSVLLVEGGSVTRTRYDKVLPTPFGEFMPVFGHWPWLMKQLTSVAAPGMRLDLARGKSPTRFEIPLDGTARDGTARGAMLASPICFEITSPGLCRWLARGGSQAQADALVSPSNDGWFGSGTWASRLGKVMHMEHAQWRCLELGLPLLRPANTGLSGLIDARGRIVRGERQDASVRTSMTPASPTGAAPDEDGWVLTSVMLGRRETLYWTVGNIPAFVVAIAGGLLAGVSLSRSRLRRLPSRP